MSRAQRLVVDKLTVSFDGFKALNELSLHVEPGELLCIIGPNGAGKTTMMDVITGRTRPSSGMARFGEANLLKMDEAQIVSTGIGRKFQKPRIFDDLTVSENLMLPLLGSQSFLRGLLMRLTGAQRERIDEVLNVIGLQDCRNAPGRLLVHSQRQWLEIGMLLICDPGLLLVDEAVAGMTPQEVDRTAKLLLSLAGEHSIVVVEHDMDFVRSIARRVIVLHEGHVLEEGGMKAIQSSPRVIEVYLGEC
ncbi:MAG: urea ABC transporter ATP-binding protein UrtD [Bryobacteraceae bacterium]